MLRRVFEQQFPVLADTAKALGDYRAEHGSDANIPRTLGRHRLRSGDAEGERAILSYQQWMLQRPLDYYQGLDGDTRAEVDDWLRGLGGYEAMQLSVPARLSWRDNRVVFEA